MIESISLENYGGLQSINWDSLGKINLIIGTNGRGKSFVLKAIYTALKTVEAYGRGQNNKTIAEILGEKLYWTFQPRILGDLVKKGSVGGLSFQMLLDEGSFSYRFGESTTKMISTVDSTCTSRKSNTVFIPEKEVLSICSIIRSCTNRLKPF